MSEFCDRTSAKFVGRSGISPDSPTSTAITMSAPIARTVWTGRFCTVPPSVRTSPSCSTGAKTPGTDMLARIASATFPFEKT